MNTVVKLKSFFKLNRFIKNVEEVKEQSSEQEDALDILKDLMLDGKVLSLLQFVLDKIFSKSENNFVKFFYGVISVAISVCGMLSGMFEILEKLFPGIEFTTKEKIFIFAFWVITLEVRNFLMKKARH